MGKGGKLLWDDYKGCEPHSFVEIRMNGELFYFDPEAEMASRKAGISCRLFNRQEYNTLNILYLEKGRELPSFRIYKWWKDL